MMNSMKINKLEIENVKRVKAVKLEPSTKGLTIIGGDNNQGKTSVLDAIAWGLGGNKFRPSDAKRRESVIPPNLKITMNNGLIVERKGKNSDLKITDPMGNKGGQQLLDSFVEELALDLPKFMDKSSKEKAQVLLNIIGVGEELYKLEEQEQETYNKRLAIGQIADQKEKFAKEQVYYPDAPKTLVSATELIQRQQEVLVRNGENARQRNRKAELEREETRLSEEINAIKNQLEIKTRELDICKNNLSLANKTVEELYDESTEELEKSINGIEEINIKVRTNLDKEKAEEDAKEYREQYKSLSANIEKIRQAQINLLKGAQLPLEGLSVEDGELTYKGYKWDGMSGANRLKVATAIVQKLKPQCGFVLMDKLEQMDLNSLEEFGTWLEEQGLQVIATRVSKGEECSIVIEDGLVMENQLENNAEIPKWKAGEF